MALDLKVDEKTRSVAGSATLLIERRAASGKSIRLDAVGFDIEKLSLTAKGKKTTELSSPRDFSYDGEEIVISLGDDFVEGELKIEYHAVPRLGLYFLAPDDKVPGRPHQVWSQCQDEDGRHWFPCQDKPHVKMTYELRATVKNGWTVLSGGELVEKKTPARGPWIFHHRLDVPTPAYLVTLVAGEFDEWTEKLSLPSKKVIPLRYLVPKGATNDGKRAFSRTAAAITLFSEKTGIDYPFDRYSQVVVHDFIFGGMENTTATTMYEHILIDQKAAIDIDSHDLVAHELAHQWFGDLVTCRDWSHAWLNEGFATYFEHVEREARLGLDEYEHNVTADLNVYLSEARGSYERAIVCRDYEEPIDLFDRHLYQKGGLVLHMLRRRLGDDCFWRSIKSYLQKHRGGIVETNDLMRVLEEESGLSLEQFFDEWVYRPGHPELKVKIAYDSGILTVDVEQTQKGKDVAIFELPFEIEVAEGKQTTLHARTITQKTSSLVVRLETRPESVTIDPNYLLCAPITLTAPTDLLKTLLKKGERARARRMAAMALGRKHGPDVEKALSECLLANDEVWMVRAKAAESLGKIRGAKAESALVSAAASPDPKVRRAVAGALGQLRTEAAHASLLSLTKDESYLVVAAAAGGLAASKAEGSAQVLKTLLKRNSWSEVIRSAAIHGLSTLGDETHLDTLLEWSNYGKPLRARRAAISAIPKLGEGKKVRLHLEDMLHDSDPHVRSSVLSAISSLGEPQAQTAISELLESELDGGVRTRARRVLSELKNFESNGLKAVHKDNERLTRELADLKCRLDHLEQLSKAKPTKPTVSQKKGAKKTVPRKRRSS